MKKAVWHIGIAFIMPDRRTIVCMEQKNVRPDISFLFYYPFFRCLSFFILRKLYVRIFFLLEVLNIHCIGVFFSGVLSLVRNVNGRAAVWNKALFYEKKQMLKL